MATTAQSGTLGFPLCGLGAFASRFIIRLYKINVADAEGAGEVKESYDSRVASTPFEIADILLSEARDLGELLLGEAFLPP
jgi:hypothetical protein